MSRVGAPMRLKTGTPLPLVTYRKRKGYRVNKHSPRDCPYGVCAVIQSALAQSLGELNFLVMKANMIRISFFLVMFASPSFAFSGNELYENCTDNNYGAVFCAGFGRGVGEVMISTRLYGYEACFPGVSDLQLRDILRRWLAEHPQDRHYSASSLVARALSETFPCR